MLSVQKGKVSSEIQNAATPHPLAERWHSAWCVQHFTLKITAEFTPPRVQLGILHLNQFPKNRKHLFKTKLKILYGKVTEKCGTDVAETRSLHKSHNE